MSQEPLTPTLSPQTGRGWKLFDPLAPRERGERGARVSGRVRGRRRRERILRGITLVALVLALAGCGKRNAPQPPPDVPNTYPRPYPSE